MSERDDARARYLQPLDDHIDPGHQKRRVASTFVDDEALFETRVPPAFAVSPPSLRRVEMLMLAPS